MWKVFWLSNAVSGKFCIPRSESREYLLISKPHNKAIFLIFSALYYAVVYIIGEWVYIILTQLEKSAWFRVFQMDFPNFQKVFHIDYVNRLIVFIRIVLFPLQGKYDFLLLLDIFSNAS